MSDDKRAYVDMLDHMATRTVQAAVEIGKGLSLASIAHFLSLAAAQCYAITIARTELHGGQSVEKGEEAAMNVFREQLKSLRQAAKAKVVSEEARSAGPKS